MKKEKNMDAKTNNQSEEKQDTFKFSKWPILLTKPKKNVQQPQMDPSQKLVNDQSSYRIKEAYKTARTNLLFALKKNLSKKFILK